MLSHTFVPFLDFYLEITENNNFVSFHFRFCIYIDALSSKSVQSHVLLVVELHLEIVELRRINKALLSFLPFCDFEVMFYAYLKLSKCLNQPKKSAQCSPFFQSHFNWHYEFLLWFFCGAAFYLISCLVVYYEKTLELCQDRYHILSQYRGQNKHCWIKFLKRLYFWQFWFDMKKSNLKFWVSNIPCKIPWISIKILTYIFWNVSIGCVLMWLQFSNHLGNFYQPNSRCNFAFFSPLLLPTL